MTGIKRLATALHLLILFELESGNITGGLVTKSLCHRISCSQFSYAHIEPTVILGVFGTLRALSREECAIVNDFGVNTYSFVLSVHGSYNLIFDKVDQGITIEAEKERHSQEIANTMK